MKKYFKSYKGAADCPICERYSDLSHKGNCMFAQENVEKITSGIDPNTGKIFNYYLAQQAAEKDVEVKRIIKDNLERMQYRPKLSQLVVPSYNRIHKILSDPLSFKQRPSRRDRSIFR